MYEYGRYLYSKSGGVGNYKERRLLATFIDKIFKQCTKYNCYCVFYFLINTWGVITSFTHSLATPSSTAQSSGTYSSLYNPICGLLCLCFLENQNLVLYYLLTLHSVLSTRRRLGLPTNLFPDK